MYDQQIYALQNRVLELENSHHDLQKVAYDLQEVVMMMYFHSINLGPQKAEMMRIFENRNLQYHALEVIPIDEYPYYQIKIQ